MLLFVHLMDYQVSQLREKDWSELENLSGEELTSIANLQLSLGYVAIFLNLIFCLANSIIFALQIYANFRGNQVDNRLSEIMQKQLEEDK